MAKNKPSNHIQGQKVAPVSQTRQASVKSGQSASFFKLPKSQNPTILYNKTNYIIMGVGGLLIILGFILMSGGNQDPKVFNAEELYSFRRITLAPISILIGFAVIAFAILKKPTTNSITE